MPEKTINEEAELPENWVPLDQPPLVPGQSHPGVPFNSTPQYLQGSLPPVFQHDTTFVDTAIKSPNVPNLSLMPLGIQGNPSTNAGIQSSSTTVVQEVNNVSSQVIAFSTNGIPNPDQEALNITAGTGLSATAGAAGLVTLAVTGTDVDFYQTVQRNASSATQRPKLNFSTDFTVADNAGNTSTDIGITFPADTDYYQTVQEQTTSRTQRPKLNFIHPLTATDNGGNTSTDIAITGSALGPPITANYYQALSGAVAVTNHTPTLIDSIAVTMPSTGGPWRAFVGYTYNKNGGVDYTAWIFDGTNGWGGGDYVTQNNLTSLQNSSFSPVTYANSAVVTFSVNIYDTGNSIIEPLSQIYSTSPAVSNMQVSIIASN